MVVCLSVVMMLVMVFPLSEVKMSLQLSHLTDKAASPHPFPLLIFNLSHKSFHYLLALRRYTSVLLR